MVRGNFVLIVAEPIFCDLAPPRDESGLASLGESTPEFEELSFLNHALSLFQGHHLMRGYRFFWGDCCQGFVGGGCWIPRANYLLRVAMGGEQVVLKDRAPIFDDEVFLLNLLRERTGL